MQNIRLSVNSKYHVHVRISMSAMTRPDYQQVLPTEETIQKTIKIPLTGITQATDRSRSKHCLTNLLYSGTRFES